MTLPLCAELPLMMLFSMLCTDDDGDVVDMRVHGDNIPMATTTVTGPTLFGGSNIDTDTKTSIKTKTFSSSLENHRDNNDESDRMPYCDEVPRGSVPVCGDRKDMDEVTGLFPCGGRVQEEDWRDCKHGDNDNDDNDDDEKQDADELIEHIGDDLGNLMKDD